MVLISIILVLYISFSPSLLIKRQIKYSKDLSVIIDNKDSLGILIKIFAFKFLAFLLYIFIQFSFTSNIFLEYLS